MPRHSAISRNADAAPPRPHVRTIAVQLSQADSIAAWDALVQRCGSAQGAFEALVLLPAALRAAGIDPGTFLRDRPARDGAAVDHDIG